MVKKITETSVLEIIEEITEIVMIRGIHVIQMTAAIVTETAIIVAITETTGEIIAIEVKVQSVAIK